MSLRKLLQHGFACNRCSARTQKTGFGINCRPELGRPVIHALPLAVTCRPPRPEGRSHSQGATQGAMRPRQCGMGQTRRFAGATGDRFIAANGGSEGTQPRRRSQPGGAMCHRRMRPLFVRQVCSRCGRLLFLGAQLPPRWLCLRRALGQPDRGCQ